MAFVKRVSKLKEIVLSERVSGGLKEELLGNTGKDDFFTVFLSVCNKKERARVFHASGRTLAEAWGGAEKRLGEFLKKQIAAKKPFAAVWAKADVVTGYEEIRTVDLNKVIVSSRWHNFARVGISFGGAFGRAFLEAEVNGNKMLNYSHSQNDLLTGNIDYDAMPLNLANINHYQKFYYGAPPVTEIPDKIITFTARGFFCDESDAVYELYCDGMDYGRRRIGLVDGSVVNEVMVSASEYLVRQIDGAGRFVYGYFPIFGAQIENYNILRHTSTLWSIINLYRISGDDSLIPELDRAIGYIDGFIEYKDAKTAYLV
ncbi:MAG: hypothetical protein FWF05_09765, partial [Oscillospiraceae bacterium]|nr:hypothetical protein [Oscillospiraceae bacterium]